MMTNDEKYMSRCIQLARNGLCNTPPNPMVGAVIVHNDRIIGEGYHVRCGEGHAEVNAIRSVRDESLLKEATLYVSLEPCSHFGKTPPCADLIISKGIPRVVVGCLDPFSLVAGKGIKKLQDAGVKTTIGILENDCKNLIKRFVVFNTLKRPFVTLKWAESSDGFIDTIRTSGSPALLSTPLSSLHVHKQRAEHQAILVGTQTALLDNPRLTVRSWYGRNPIRLVIDRTLRLPSTLHLFDGSTPTWVFTAKERDDSPNVTYIKLDFGKDILMQILQYLHQQKIQSVLVEGGSRLLQTFINNECWDEAYVEHAACLLGNGVKAPLIPAGNPSDYLFRDHIPIVRYQNRQSQNALTGR